jgi:O-antigen ligase
MDRSPQSTGSVLTIGVVALLVLAVAAGGATWQASPWEAWVILPSIPLFALALFHHLSRRPTDWSALLLVAATLALPILHSVPWPGSLAPWSAIHSTWQFDQARVFGVSPPATLSVAPDASFRAFLALLPPAAVFLVVRLLDARRQRQTASAIVGLALLSAALGLLQAALGESLVPSPLGSSSGQAKGLFSNRNHFSALMYVGIALSGAGLVAALRRMLSAPEPARHGPWVIGWAVGFLLLVVACMVAQSRAGVVIGAGVVLALFAIILVDTARSAKGSRRLFALVSIVAVLAAVQVGLWGVVERFKVDPFEDGRVVVQTTTLQAARESLPWGAGIGTFRRVYEQREPLDSVFSAWVNRAHNDWLEFHLEAGWPGAVLLAAWVFWWFGALIHERRRRSVADHASQLLRTLAFVAVLAIALHSLVDFPMRTIAMFSIVAALVAISVGPRRGDERDWASSGAATANSGRGAIADGAEPG